MRKPLSTGIGGIIIGIAILVYPNMNVPLWLPLFLILGGAFIVVVFVIKKLR